MKNLCYDLLTSWLTKNGVNPIERLYDWIDEQNRNVNVRVEQIELDKSDYWFYENGLITNKNKSFFAVSGIQQFHKGSLLLEQPIILQHEIGFLGIICREINGILHFLMQAKVEPGNINKVQVSPTLQATLSNFTQKHGGNKPAFLDYFIQANPKQILVDQIQSEQSSRFYKKRNRNVILFVDEPINEPPTHKWMTLGQIKDLMRHNNLVNMDTRTVLSCIPFALMDLGEEALKKIEDYCNDKPLLRSLTGVANQRDLVEIFNAFNNYKMFGGIETKLIDLYSLNNWEMEQGAFVCTYPYPFDVIFCNITIEGREVTNWTQPLFKAKGIATFGLLCCVDGGVKKILTKATPEVGCFDGIELGPTVQQEPFSDKENDEISFLFYKKLSLNDGVKVDVLLSEEGGRFYHEQNRNVIIELMEEDIPLELPEGYFWSDFKTLNTLVQVNNCLNIQLRNLLSLLEV